MDRRGLVLDANILVRAVFGQRVLHIIESHEDDASFYAPDVCFLDAEKYIPRVSKQRGLNSSSQLTMLRRIGAIVELVDWNVYKQYEPRARDRIASRDPDDWPVVAVALLLNLPIWTEDKDFFGSGIATWTTDRVELYLRQQ